MVNWAKVWDGPALGGGVNGYMQSLALELVRLGHDVATVCSGWSYSGVGARAEGMLGPVHAVRHPDWLGISVFEIVNSPVIAPSALQRDEANEEISQPDLERIFSEILASLKPDLIHFHNIEGFSAGCLRVASQGRGPEWEGAKCIYSLHNYHTLSPDVYLPASAVQLCEQDREIVEPRHVMLERAGLQTPPAYEPVPHSAPVESPRLLHSDETLPFPPAESTSRGMAAALAPQPSTAFRPAPRSAAWQPLANDPHEPIGGGYLNRRLAMVEGLNAMQRVLGVSRFVSELFIANGVERDRVETMPIGSRAVEIAAEHEELIFEPPRAFEGSTRIRPLRLVFLGYDHPYKGLHTLADALELIVPDLLAQVDLSVFAQNGARSEWRFRRLEPRLARLSYHHGYTPQDVPWMLGGRDLGVVPSIWWDNGPQTVHELLACGVPVLGARAGGIPDMVTHEGNGLLFTANDRYDLARQIVRAVQAPGLLDRLRSSVVRPRSMAEHGREMEALYQRVASEPSRSGAVQTGGVA